ncbi:FAD-dependent oxidoreductase [Lacibacter sp. H375]|uniref:FAD-dependent oxidoreductase n=1 Tax=Lacibacter sp. H375 TaxID=3133424 RepID=UPI0030C47BAF
MSSIQHSKRTSGEHSTYWIQSTATIAYPSLQSNIETDVLVIGGGIAGLSTAYCLAGAGKQVVLIEDGLIGSGESGRTTAHLTHALDDRYDELQKIFGEEKVKIIAQSHTAAIDWMEQVINTENIHCDFMRVDGYLFVHANDKFETLEKEFDATRKAGLPTELLNTVPGISNVKQPCIRFPKQAQFHIMKYLNGLARAIETKGGIIYTDTHATKINEGEVIANGYKITAKHIVVATNTPVNDLVAIHTKQFPYRTYVIAGLVPKGYLEPALWWDTGDHNSKWITHPYHYVRLQPFTSQYDLLLSGGEDHKTGQADAEGIPETERYARLIEWTREHFPTMQEIAYHWSGQVMEPLDSLAFIGKNPGSENIYIITGDSGNGMTHATIGGLLITDLINGKENNWEDIYKPTRIPLKVAGSYIKEALSMAGQYVDWVSKGDIKSFDELQNGSGAIVSDGLRKLAAYRDSKGELLVYNASCPHLGCVVQWNADEKTFDCPCHGSRFSKEGTVVNGPAISKLKRITVKEPEKHNA